MNKKKKKKDTINESSFLKGLLKKSRRKLIFLWLNIFSCSLYFFYIISDRLGQAYTFFARYNITYFHEKMTILGVWLILIINRIVNHFLFKKYLDIFMNLPKEMSRQSLSILQRLLDNRRFFFTNLFTLVGANCLIPLFSAVFGGPPPGFVIAVDVIWIIGVGIHSFFFNKHQKNFQAVLEETGVRFNLKTLSVVSINQRNQNKVVQSEKNKEVKNTLLEECESLSNKILEKIKDSESLKEKFNYQQIQQQLDNMIQELKNYIKRQSEMQSVFEGQTIEQIREDISKLAEKKQTTANPQLIKQYEYSIQQLVKQKDSLARLIEQKEFLNLKISSGKRDLAQLLIDCTRMEEVVVSQQEDKIKNLEDQIMHFTDQINNLESSYHDLENELI
ncbi:MAG: hypothetical protein MJB14_04640 [Spirochaetes bacterium]|nr:hypothetical protein [Spirochaetota bacterium]